MDVLNVLSNNVLNAAALRRAWPYALALLVVLVAKLPTINNTILFVDEPLYLAQAARLDSPYAFFHWAEFYLETKSSFSILPHIAALAISQENAILVLRLLGLAALLVSAALIVRLSVVAFRTATPGVIAALLFAFLLAKNTLTAATNLEHFQLPLLLLSLLFFVVWVRNGNSPNRVIFISGVFLGLAALVKPPALLVALGVWAALVLSHKPNTPLQLTNLLRQGALYGLGVLLPLVGFVLPYLLAPRSMPALGFALFDVTATYTTLGKDQVTRFLLLFAAMGLASALLIASSAALYLYARLRRLPELASGTDIYQRTLLLAGVALFIGNGVGQYKAHYLVVILPPLLLFTGYRLWSTFNKLTTPVVRAGLVLSIALLVAAGEVDTAKFYARMLGDGGKLYANEMPSVDASRLAEVIRAKTGDDDSIWVYSAAPELYWLSGRKPATGDPTASWISIGYNDFWFERTYRELERERPRLIIDLVEPRFQEHGERLVELPKIGQFIAENYECRLDAFPNAIICSSRLVEGRETGEGKAP